MTKNDEWEKSHFFTQKKGDNTKPTMCSHCGGRFKEIDKGWQCEDCLCVVDGVSFYQGRNNKEKEMREELKYRMYKLDWIKILANAIDMRPTSWYPLGFEPRIFVMPDMKSHEETKKYSPAEWRNASDEVCGAVIRAMEEAGMLIPLFQKEKEKRCSKK
jgi:hypothetical protein